MKLGLLYPGQGSQYVGMGERFYQNHQTAKIVFEEANDVLGFDLSALCFRGDARELTRTVNTQPALLTVSYIYTKVFFEECGIPPVLTAGHSLGEITALTCAGAIKFSDALRIVRKRGELMQDSLPQDLGMMCSVTGIDSAAIEAECGRCSNQDDIAVISNYNSFEQTIISGHKKAVLKVAENLSRSGAIINPLNVSSAFHSPLMKGAAEKFESVLSLYQFQEPNWPVISNVTALPYKSAEEIRKNLTLQIVKPVMWVDSMVYMRDYGVTTVIELGPKTVLKNLMKKIAPYVSAFSYDKLEDIKAYEMLCQKYSASENNTNYSNSRLFMDMCLSAVVCTKNSNWNKEEYQKGVIEPYRRIKALQEQLEVKSLEPSPNLLKETWVMLQTALLTKKVPADKKSARCAQILEKTGMRKIIEDKEQLH